MLEAATRQEEDSLGPVTLPRDAYYGAQTERARQNFDVSGQFIGDFPRYITAIVEVKKAAALANADIGVIRRPVADAICQAADEIIGGKFDRAQFPVDMLSAGGGVSPNMNVNEVLANRANEILTGSKGYDLVHPNNHVNTGQSTSDALATAMNVALHRDILALVDSVRLLEEVIGEKIEQYSDTVKLSRTCMQDAVPITFAQEFGAYLAVAQRGVERLTAAAEACLDVPMGGTVVGTGLGVGAGYVTRIYPRLREVTGLPLRRHPNFFDAFQNGDIFQYISTTFKALATNLAKMSKDLRLLASGPRVGMAEITLPAVQAGSSFLPGKINPVMPELMVQIGYQVCGNDMVVTFAVEGAELDFNAWTGVIAKNLFESCRLLTQAIPLFAEKCLRGLEVRTDRCRETAHNTLALSSIVATVFGYDAGARAAYHAANTGTSIKEAAIALGIMSPAAAERLLDPMILTDASRSAALVDQMLAEEQQRVASVIAELSPAVRQAIFTVAGTVARADGEISSQEEQALKVVGDALHLEPSQTEIDAAAGDALDLDVDGFALADRRLVYACGAWLASSDGVLEDSELAILERLRDELELDTESVGVVQAQVDRLRGDRRQYLPRCEALPWWEDFAELLTQVLVGAAGPPPRGNGRVVEAGAGGPPASS
ncbi:MAG: aspartate ammonia-lyase [Solirubrobacteraceae bacterium]|jgi:aspartate ammonia-lyase|nr:aspartate ammonia-lyase [Solirubrobacteraceae bacterium]